MKLTLIWFLSLTLLLGGCQSNPPEPGPAPTPPVPPVPPTPPPDPNAERSIRIEDKLKIALVIGNSNYEYKSLKNPVNDAKEVSDTLTDLGFNVDLKKDLNKRDMDEAITGFIKRLTRQQGSVAFFYYAGHGARVDGQNYLIPIDNDKIASETDVKYAAVDAARILENMQAADTHLNIMVLDACRDNPYPSNSRSLSRGLAVMQQNGSIIAFAAKEGQTALDTSTNGRNGLYTSYLVKMLKQAKQQKMRIDDMFTAVRNAVSQESNGKQEPWSSVSWRGPYCFGGCEVPVPGSTPIRPQPPQPPSPFTPTPVNNDNTPPSGKISGINPNYQIGDTIKYTVTGTDNNALKTLMFRVADSSQTETLEVGGKTNTQKSSFSTAGWPAGNYRYSLTVTDKAGNSAEVATGNFMLEEPKPIPVPIGRSYNCEDLQRKLELGSELESLTKDEENFRQSLRGLRN